MHARSIRSPKLVLALVLLISAAFVLASVPSAHAATPIYVRTDGDDTACDGTVDADATFTPNCAVQTIQKGIDLVDPGGTVFVRTGTYVLTAVVNVNKTGITLDGDGAGATIVQVSGTGDRFNISASGVTLQDFEIVKTDTTGPQDIIRISNGNSVTIKNNTVHGQYVYPAGDVSRALVINAGAFSGLNIEGNTFYSLRQPAYVSGTHIGTVQNNYTYSTKGWVLEGGDLTFTGNTWGTGAQANVYDIAILNTVPGSYYTDIVAMSNSNNGAVIEDQRPVPAVLSVVHVDAAAPVCATDCGGLNPYHTITPAIPRVVAGGTINVAAGTYAETVSIDKALTLQCAQAGVAVGSRTAGSAAETIIDASGLPTALTIKADNVSVDGCDIVGDNATYAGVLVYATTGTGNRSNVDVLNNFVHGMALPNPSSSTYVSSYGIFGLGDDVSGTRLTITDLDIIGNEIYDLGGAVSGPDTSAGAGVWLYSIQGALPGDGVTISSNDFHDIADGFNSPIPEPGSAVVIVDDGDGNPDDGALVTGNTYANIYGGDILFIGNSTLNEMGSDYTAVTLLALNVGNLATVNEPNLAPYAKTDKPTGWPSSTAYFAHVKDAIDASDTTATVTASAGTFSEGPQLLINKDIDLIGAGAGTTILKPTVDTGNSGDARGWFLVDTTGSLDLSAMTLDGTGRKVYQAIRYKGAAGSVSGVEFKEIRYNESGPDYSGFALAAFGSGKVDVSNSTFSGIGRVGVLYFGSGVSGSTYSGNTYTGKGAGDWLDYGLDISAGAAVTVDNNQVSDNRGVASVDSSASAAYLVSTYFGSGTTATFTDNTITNNTTGIVVGYNGSDTSSVVASNNCFSLNDYGVESTAPLVDAKNNSWGDPTGPYNATTNPSGLGDAVSDDVDFTPWLTTCASGPTGNFYNQTDDTYFATMQDAVDAASYGDVIVPLTAGPFGPEGSATVATSGVTIKLSGRTFGPGSPAFTITGNDVTILGPGIIDGGGSAFPGILVQTGAGNFTLSEAEVKGWADGIQVAGDVISLKITNNWIHDNSDAGLQVDGTPTGVITIKGNLFKANGGPGVTYSGSGSLNATYNSWGDLGGPTVGAGDGVGAGVTYIPWTFSELYMDVDPPTNALTRSVPETTDFDVALKVDAAKLYGLTFLVTYDPAMLTLNTTTFTTPWDGSVCTQLSVTLGVLKYRCNLTFPAAEYDATGGTIATFNFTANTMLPGNGPWYTYFDISDDPADTSTGALGGIKVFVNNAGYGAPSDPSRDITDPDDGEIEIVGLANFTGFVDLQGNDNDSGATLLVKNQQTKAGSVDLASGTSAPSGAYTTAHLPTKVVLVGSTYYLQFDAPLHLPTTTVIGSVSFPAVPTDWTNSALATTRPLTPLAYAFLLGGDATNNDVVEINDASCIGAFYQIAFTDCGGAPGSSPDVKVNGAVDIFDLVLFGSNYELTYSPWTQP